MDPSNEGAQPYFGRASRGIDRAERMIVVGLGLFALV